MIQEQIAKGKEEKEEQPDRGNDKIEEQPPRGSDKKQDPKKRKWLMCKNRKPHKV